MTASLPMYDTGATAAANNRLWHAIRARIGFGPETLNREEDPHITWQDPELVLSQTCGLPYRSTLHTDVTLVGTPDYDLPDCPPGYYYSVIVARKDDARQNLTDFKGARLARNDPRSQSGWAALENHLVETDAGFSFVGQVHNTGSHAASAQAVSAGTADIAALDGVTWQLLKRDTDVTGGLRVLERTRPTPGLPLITSPNRSAPQLFAAVERAISDLSDADRTALLLKGLVPIPAEAYLAEPLPPVEK